MRDHFIGLFKYKDRAMREVAKSISEANIKEGRIIELLSHIVNSQRIWPNRILQRNIVIDPWENHTVEKCVELSARITSEGINFVEGM